MAPPVKYFSNPTFKAKDASLNVTHGNMTGANAGLTDHSVRVTTGVDNTVTIDICGLAAAIATSTGSTLRVRADTYDYTGNNLEETYISPPLYWNDISLVMGDIAATSDNIGKKHKNAKKSSPLYFRTLCGDGIAQATNRAIRVTIKEDVLEFVKNGKHINIFTQVRAPGANFDNDACDISFTKVDFTPPQVLVNGGPLGVDDAVPAFSAVMVKTTGTAGVVRALTSEPLFENAGAGIDLSTVVFRIKDKDSPYDEFFYNLGKPSSFPEIKNADGLYQYDVSTITNVTDSSVAGKSFKIIITGVGDNFDVCGYAMQKSTNLYINLDNKPAFIGANDITVDADSAGQTWQKEGKKAIVSFTAPSTPEGQPSIKKYEARWVTKAQADVMKNLNFDLVKAAYPNQVNENTDICDTLTYQKGASTIDTKVTLDLPSNSVVQSDGSGNDLTRYGVFVRAFTKDDNGSYVAGAIAADVSTSFFNPAISGDITSAGRTGLSLGFFVSAAPAVPTHIAVKTGKGLLRSDTSTDTDTKKDASMNNHVMVNMNDYNVDQRGSNYTKVKYAVVRAKDAQYGATLADASFTDTDVQVTWNGNDATSEFFNISGGSMKHTYNTTTGVWDAIGPNAKDLSNGEEFAVSYAFDNSNGLGQRTAWYNFTPSKMTDTSLCLFSLDPSNHRIDGTTNSGFGSITGAGAIGREISNNGTYIALNAAEKATMKVTQNNGSIGFGFSLLDASNTALKAAGKPYDTSLNFNGGLAPNSIRYFVNKSPLTNTNITDPIVGKRRRFGQAQKDVSGYNTADTALLLNAAAQTVAATIDTNRLVVSQGRDASNALTNLKLGQRYDICFGIQNANGFNDLSLAKCSGFAPMGEIKALNRVRINPDQRPTPEITAIANGNAKFDVCFNDLCGAAQHGGHVITHVFYEVTQYQGELSGNQVLRALDNVTVTGTFGNTINDFFTDRDGCSNDIATDGARSRGIQIQTNSNTALPGYPMKLTIYGVAKVDSTNATDLRYDNYLHNVGGADVCGAATVLNIPGPTLGSSATDDVRSLQAIPADKKIKVSFFKPLTTNVVDQYQGSPSVNAYHIYQYDMSLDATGLSNKTALSRTVKVINDSQTLASDFVETELDGINGKGYVVAVHTQWRYGINNDSLELSKGVYSSNFSSASGIDDPSQNTPGPGNWKLPATVGALTLRSGTTRASLAVPHGVPSIELGTNSLVFRDNGDALTVGAMIQISPKPSSGTAGAFYLDLCANATSSNNTITTLKVNGHATNSKVYTVSPTNVLGTNWSTEQNFIVVQNTAGSAYVKQNIN
jgi:hypothetical protein